MTQRTNVFISYSHKDVKWLKRLHVHLKPLERTGRIQHWDDAMISPGAEWHEAIRQAIDSAKVAVLLVSADFLASDFIATEELPLLLAAAKAEGAVILPVILSPSLYEETSLAQFQAVNPPSQPLNSLPKAKQEAVLVKVAEAIEQAFNISHTLFVIIPPTKQRISLLRKILTRNWVPSLITAMLVILISSTGIVYWCRIKTPVLEEWTLYIRRHKDDSQITVLSLVSKGESKYDHIAPIEPLRSDDDFRLEGRFNCPTPWYLLWIDSAGRAFLAAKVDQPQQAVRYPSSANEYIEVDDEDPTGNHLLYLVAGKIEQSQVDILVPSLRDIGRPPVTISPDAGKDKGPGEVTPGPQTLEGLVTGIEQRLPAHAKPAYYLLIPSKQR